ncbi:MAG: enoyl-CoA hydratase/isomerase family protein, partial [Anaerolineales bacterium]|nr:enoyl-CoA hydratase/isomerase family protein [Anaerolineales bacterium]
MDRFETILWEQADQVATITMNRPQVRNAQNQLLLDELDRAFDRAAIDDSIGVIILAGAGDDFSSGHDVSSEKVKADSQRSWEERYEICRRNYLKYHLSWRNLPKPTIAMVQGNCIMGGMMLALACDLVVCADNARFISRSVRWGASSEQFLMLPWFVGVP